MNIQLMPIVMTQKKLNPGILFQCRILSRQRPLVARYFFRCVVGLVGRIITVAWMLQFGHFFFFFETGHHFLNKIRAKDSAEGFSLVLTGFGKRSISHHVKCLLLTPIESLAQLINLLICLLLKSDWLYIMGLTEVSNHHASYF